MPVCMDSRMIKLLGVDPESTTADIIAAYITHAYVEY